MHTREAATHPLRTLFGASPQLALFALLLHSRATSPLSCSAPDHKLHRVLGRLDAVLPILKEALQALRGLGGGTLVWAPNPLQVDVRLAQCLRPNVGLGLFFPYFGVVLSLFYACIKPHKTT